MVLLSTFLNVLFKFNFSCSVVWSHKNSNKTLDFLTLSISLWMLFAEQSDNKFYLAINALVWNVFQKLISRFFRFFVTLVTWSRTDDEIGDVLCMFMPLILAITRAENTLIKTNWKFASRFTSLFVDYTGSNILDRISLHRNSYFTSQTSW